MQTTQTLIAHLSNLSYLSIYGISIIANVFIPVPEEVVLLALGYVARAGHTSIYILIPIVMAGLLTSDIVMFILSQKKNRIVTYFYKKFFAHRLSDKQSWIDDNIESVIFFSRFLIQLRFLGPFLAGQHGVSWKKFLTYELLALIIYVPLVLWCGWYFHGRIEAITAGIGIIRNSILILFGIVVLYSLSRSITHRMFGKKKRPYGNNTTV